MAQDGNDGNIMEFYPAYCFKASPTYFSWVKMSAAMVHQLQSRPEYEGNFARTSLPWAQTNQLDLAAGQNLFFYKNHPIRFVCVAGLIVSREDYERRTLLNLDDSSGSTLEVVIVKASSATETSTSNAAASTEEEEEQTPIPAPAGTEINKPQLQHVSASTKQSIPDTDTLTVGTVAKLKGTLSRFRNSMQLVLERFTILRDPNAEVRFWDERTRFLVDVLSVPWSLTSGEVAHLRRLADQEREKAAEERKRVAERQLRHAQREERHYHRILRRWEREEKRREKEAEAVARANAQFMEVVAAYKKLRHVR